MPKYEVERWTDAPNSAYFFLVVDGHVRGSFRSMGLAAEVDEIEKEVNGADKTEQAQS